LKENPGLNLKLDNVSKQFGSHRALSGVCLEMSNVHTLVLIGPSGGGKTTLLRILAGLETPDSGTVELNAKRIEYEESALRSHRKSVGVVFQAFNLFPHLSALQNITLPLEQVHGTAPIPARDRALELLHRFQLQEHIHKKPAALSGGQRQRVAIARALAIKARVLLFDEPTSALDPEMTAEVLDMIEQLRAEGSELILVTHQMGFARRAADRIAFLAEGKVLEFGPASQIFESPSTEKCRRFLSTVLKY
jgi:polar amino acid transport system ATP-binding protein